jgi:hypothetical protein
MLYKTRGLVLLQKSSNKKKERKERLLLLYIIGNQFYICLYVINNEKNI